MSTAITKKIIYNLGFLLDGQLGISREFEIDYPKVVLEDLELSPLKGNFTASRADIGIYIQGTLHSYGEAQCSRCNIYYTQPIIIQLDEHYYTFKTVPDDNEEAFVVPATGLLNLGKLIRIEAIMAMPLQPFCKDDCQGLCIDCGQNLNIKDCGCEDDLIDPRFAALKKLLDSQESESDTES